MKFAIMSDCHDNWVNLEKAVNIANEKKCSYLLFAGDFISPLGIDLFEKFRGDVKIVWGNNEAEKNGMMKRISATKNVELCGDLFEGIISGCKIFMNHYPRFAQLAAKSKEYDLCIYGHTHEYYSELIGQTLLINPGEIHGYKTGEVGFVIYNMDTNETQRVIINK